MRGHSSNELNTVADILDIDADGDTQTVLASSIPCGVQSVGGDRKNDAQFSMPQTTHMVLMRYPDSEEAKESGYIQCEGVLYVVDYIFDAYTVGRAQRPRVWNEIYCHATRTN